MRKRWAVLNRKSCAVRCCLAIAVLTPLPRSLAAEPPPSLHDAWQSAVHKQTAFYDLEFLPNWHDQTDPSSPPEQLFEASGKFLPLIYKGAPVMVNLFLTRQAASDVNEGAGRTLEGLHTSKDRVFPGDFEDEGWPIRMPDGHPGWMLHTRFLRKSKGLQQSRYDFVVYSSRAHAAFVYTLSVQHGDATYGIEAAERLKDSALQIFSHLRLKEPPPSTPHVALAHPTTPTQKP
jgi:hypothetical protein